MTDLWPHRQLAVVTQVGGTRTVTYAIPECATHGPMHYQPPEWLCRGFDGEGCPARVTDAQVFADDLPEGVTCDWQPLGTVDTARYHTPGHGAR